jgi:phosphopantetheinyl transferase
LSRIPAEERAQYDQFRTEATRESYLAARVLCRVTLSKYAGIDPSAWRFGRAVNEKPTLVEPSRFKSLRFNLTHTNDLVICVVTRAGEVGVDAEDTSRPVDALLVARHFLSGRQAARLASLDLRERARRFFEQWVLKEAYVKATGKGLADTPERLTVEQRNDGWPVAMGDCQLSLYRPSSNHVAAAAVLSQHKTGSVAFEWLIATEIEATAIELYDGTTSSNSERMLT